MSKNYSNLIPFGTAKIDSFSLLIPYDEEDKNALIVSSTFNEAYRKVYYTGEAEEDVSFYNNYEKVTDTKTATFVKYKIVRRLWNGENKAFVQIMLTSKLLLNDYFQGINKSNINVFVNRINRDKIIKVDALTLLNGYVVDIDLCKDYQVNESSFTELKKQLIDLVIPSKLSVINSKKVNSKEMFGVQYNERHKATPTKPFAKLYFKTTELINKSKDFYNRNLLEYSDIIKQGIARFEVTIKASQHKKKLGIEDVKTLNDLVSIPGKDLDKIYTDIVNQYYKKTKPSLINNPEKMSTSNLIILNLINKLIRFDDKITTAELIHIAQIDAYDKRQKHDAKNKILEVISLSENRERINKNDEDKKQVIDVLKDLEIFED